MASLFSSSTSVFCSGLFLFCAFLIFLSVSPTSAMYSMLIPPFSPFPPRLLAAKRDMKRAISDSHSFSVRPRPTQR